LKAFGQDTINPQSVKNEIVNVDVKANPKRIGTQCDSLDGETKQFSKRFNKSIFILQLDDIARCLQPQSIPPMLGGAYRRDGHPSLCKAVSKGFAEQERGQRAEPVHASANDVNALPNTVEQVAGSGSGSRHAHGHGHGDLGHSGNSTGKAAWQHPHWVHFTSSCAGSRRGWVRKGAQNHARPNPPNSNKYGICAISEGRPSNC
jgi:hypothetical protein